MAILMLFILLVMVFVVMRVLPGDPVAIMAGQNVPQEEIERIRHQLGLDRPLQEQFLSYVSDMLTGNLGESLRTHRAVTIELASAYPTTVELTIVSLLIGILGLPAGIVSVLKKDSIIDHFLRGFMLGGYSIPPFLLGMLLQIFFGWYLGILPISGRFPATLSVPKITGLYTLDSLIALNPNLFIESIKYLALPSVTLGLGMMPLIHRMARASILDQMREDYITTARAKGIPERIVVYKHALRNALLPIITVIGLSLSGLLGGTVLIETVFSLPGLGRLLVTGLLNRDFPVVQAVVLTYAIVVVVVNTAIDILYAVVDPRVKY
jgi:peptide/nickel transport system permease protein